MVANKFKGIRAASVTNEKLAEAAKADDDINVIALSGDTMDFEECKIIIDRWLNTEFKGGRYKKRLDMLEKIEEENMK